MAGRGYPRDLRRRTKIVCTIGPASGSPLVIERLIRAGMNVARLNFSHGTHEQHAGYIRAIRHISARLGQTVAIMQDLPGSKGRTGKLRDGQVCLREGAGFTLTTGAIVGDERRVSINLPGLPQQVKPGDNIFLNDGAIQLKVVATADTEVRCQVVVGGPLGPGKGVNVPGVTLDLPAITDQDIGHLAFGLKQGVDFVALSFMRRADDILQVKRLLRERGAEMPLIAKIERQEALSNIDEILASADGVMVARGDLGLEIPVQRVPLAQKEIIRKCNRAGKPVIVATQMLESMVASPSPTRAEVADVANAILDGTDAIMLSGETATGRYPVRAVRMMSRIALETEAALPYAQILEEKGVDLERQTDDAISYAACHTAQQLGASAIVAFTASGNTARRVAKYRPQAPILALTPNEAVKRRLTLLWGVHPFQVAEPLAVEDMFAEGGRRAVETAVAGKGDLIVITAGVPIGDAGGTNLLKVARIG
ncbi:MAG: pyruvate kinase [Dehalococcoidia bacterium]